VGGRLIRTLIIAAGLASLAVPAAADPLDPVIAHDLSFAQSQLQRTLAEVPVNSYPSKTGSDGHWVTTDASAWTSGFFPGSLWLMYRATGDPAWRDAAAARQAGVESRKTDTSTHDVGFQIFNSFGNGFKLTHDDHYRQVVLTAAGSLATRYSDVVHAIRSWNNSSNEYPYDFQVIIDNMMNLELLLWASKNGGDAAWYSEAVAHAVTTSANHVRPDGSTYQRVIFDSTDGHVRSHPTVQGYSDDSTWSRGQAWALNGFTMAYRETGDGRFLDTARRTADYFIAHLPSDSVPYWDFQAPGIPNEPRDTSAAAIAASGLIELSGLDPDLTNGARYLGAARAILESLSSPAYLAEGTSSRSILLHGTGNRPAGDYDTGLVFGDYYFIEALLRYRDRESAGAPAAGTTGSVPPGATTTTTPHGLSLKLRSRRVKLRTLLRRGLAVEARLAAPSTLTCALYVTRGHRRGPRVARRKTSVASPGTRMLRLRVTRRGRRTLVATRPSRLQLACAARETSGHLDLASVRLRLVR
jgi:unsaturated chondroitin disaccharide hydrolase